MGDGTQRRRDADGVDDALNKENRVRKRRFALHRIRHGVMAFNFQGEVWYSKDPDSYFEEQGQSLRYLSFVSQCFIALRDTFQLPVQLFRRAVQFNVLGIRSSRHGKIR
jgi:hypothetical protein